MKLKKEHIIFFTFFMLIVANSKYLIKQNISSYFEYFALGLLTIEVLYTFFKEKEYKNKKLMTLFIVSNILFCVGITLQNLPFSSILRLVFTMIALSTYMLLSKNYLNSYKLIRTASYGIFFGMIATTIIGLSTYVGVLERIRDNILFVPLNYGFSAGMQMKNMTSTTLTACFIGIALYFKHVKKTKIDFLMLILLTVIQPFCVSKGGLIIFVLVLFLMFCDRKKKLFAFSLDRCSLGFKMLLIGMFGFFMCLIFMLIYNNFLVKSVNYNFRMKGIENYINLVKNDKFHLYFGSAEIAFADPNKEYMSNIRDYLDSKGFVGYAGSYEAGFINTLIKNGVLGLIGFAIVYIWIIKNAMSLKRRREKVLIIGIFLILLVSSLVESYVCNIHQMFGIYCYLLMNGLMYIGDSKEGDSK